MVVYIEYAFAENFMMDLLLLYLSLRCVKNRISWVRLILAAAIGGGEAILFPVIEMPVWCAYFVKFLGGVLIVIVAVSEKGCKPHLKTIAIFFLSTFALGGLLTAVYSFFGIEYVEGRGYLVERIPIALLFGVSGLFAVFVRRLGKSFGKKALIEKNIYAVSIEENGNTVHGNCFLDSGNLLQFHERPVCVISAVAALKLFRDSKPIGRINVKTVSGEKQALVFQIKRMTIDLGKKQLEHRNVLFTIGEIHIKNCFMLLHTSYSEELYENSIGIEMLAAKD